MIYILVGDSPSIKHDLQLISLCCVSFSVFLLLIWSFSDCRNNDCNGYGLWSPEFPQLTLQWQKIFASVELFLHFLLLVITEIMAWVWFWGDRWQRKAKQLSSHRIRMESTVWMSCKSSMNRITIHCHYHHSLACNHHRHHHHHSPSPSPFTSLQSPSPSSFTSLQYNRISWLVIIFSTFDFWTKSFPRWKSPLY